MNKRLVQFVIERDCPEAASRFPDRAVRDDIPLPMAVWVEWPPEQAGPSVECSATVVYRVESVERRRLHRAIAKSGKGLGFCVCEHMGHVIE